MKTVVFLIYNLLLPLIVLLGLPAWVLKMYRRGGFGSGLLERVGLYGTPEDESFHGAIYVHAVSVGETLIALKLIDQWRKMYPEQKFVLVPTTATGHEVAKKREDDFLKVVYSPVDFPFLVKKALDRFQPQLIVLIESELWPNLLAEAENRAIPVALVNARLSERSERRYKKVKHLVSTLFEMLDVVCIQDDRDEERFGELGIATSKIFLTGSIKFDQEGVLKPQRREEFSRILDSFSINDESRDVVLGVSTFPGEEVLLAKAVKSLSSNALCVITPRHAERRMEVKADLKNEGFSVVLRSAKLPEKIDENAVLVIDSTGELRDWTAHADLVVIGKSFFEDQGGQNPTEAIAAQVPVVCGPYMQNFQALMEVLQSVDGIKQLQSADELFQEIAFILGDSKRRERLCKNASAALEIHQQATTRTVDHLVSVCL